MIVRKPFNCFFFIGRPHSAFQSTVHVKLLYRIVSYRRRMCPGIKVRARVKINGR